MGDYEYMIEPVDVDQPASITNTSFHGNHIIYRTTDHEGHEDAIDCEYIKRIALIMITIKNLSIR